MAPEVGGTTLASESLGSETGFSDHACVEKGGIPEMTRECVPGGFKELFSTHASLFWEGEGGSCGDSSCVCACGIEAPKGTLE